jgi:signal transduction histidine kinase/ligand-binding sensor domain-containing protein/ActR/RegA family two-component response regulator
MRILLLLLFFPLIALTQNNQIRFRQFTEIEHFPSKFVECITQDSLGFLWMGTYDGLVRFDGYEYRSYQPKIGDKNSLETKQIFDLKIGKHNTIWIGTSKGITQYNQEKDEFVNLNYQYKTLAFNNSTIRTILVDGSNLWVGSEYGLFLYNTESHKAITLKKGLNISKIVKQKNLVFIATEKNGILIFDNIQKHFVGEITPARFPQFKNEHYSVQEMKIDKNGNLWFVTSNTGFYCYSITNNELKQIQLSFPTLPKNTFFLSLDIEDDQNYWIGTLNSGLISCIDGELQHIESNDNASVSIPANTIDDIFRDRTGNIWFSCQLGTFFMFNKTDLAIKYFNHRNKDKSSLAHSIVQSFSEDKNGNIWVGTDGGGVSVYNNQWNIIKTLSYPQSLSSNAVTGISYDNNQYMYVAQWGGGIDECNVETMNCKNIFTKSDTAISRYDTYNDLKSTFLDSKHRLWIIPHLSTLWVKDIPSGKLYNSAHTGNLPKQLFKLLKLIGVIEDTEHTLWFFGYNGLFYLKSDNSFELFQFSKDKSNTISSDRILNVFCDSKGRVWVCTDNGLDLFNNASHSFKRLDEHNFPSLFFSLQEDKNGILWFSSNKGIGQLYPNTMTLNFSHKNIPIDNESYNEKAGYTTKNGRILFGSTNGFISIDPSIFKKNTIKPPIVITSVYVLNKQVSLKDSNSLLPIQIEYCRSLTFQADQKVISFKFSALNFNSPEKNEYIFKLEGFDKEWQKSGSVRKITYTNLSPGNYILKIKASNDELVWNDKGISINITILPAWWQTLWFKVTLLLVLALAVFIYVKYKSRLLRIQNELLTQQVTERTQEIRDKNKRLEDQSTELEIANITKEKMISLIAHDIRSAFSIVVMFSDLLRDAKNKNDLKSKEELIGYIHASSHNAFHVLNNLLYWVKSQKKRITITTQWVDVNSLTDEIITLYSFNAKEKNIMLKSDASIHFKAMIDSNIFQTILRNLLNNAIKFTPRNGSIEVSLQCNNVGFAVSVLDNGIGMDESLLTKIRTKGNDISITGTDGELGSGLGLALCLDLIEHHKASYEVFSQEGKGTLFTIKFNCECIELKSTINNEDTIFEKGSNDIAKININTLINPKDLECLKGKKILIVDDNDFFRSLLVELLSPYYIILEARNGEDGLIIVKNNLPDLIISDIMMPIMDGLTFSSKIKEDTKTGHIPIIVVTSMSEDIGLIQGLVTVDDYIIKPPNFEILLLKVSTLIIEKQKKC